MFGVLLAYLKRRDVGGTYLESHVVWQTRTFWIWLALWLAGWFTVILVVGWLLLGLAYVWLIYRIIKGWMLLADARPIEQPRSEEHTSELQSLMRNSYAVFCLKKKKRKH